MLAIVRTMRRKSRREFFECQHCGADVLVGSAACKECGSDAGTGWQSGEEIDYQSLDLPQGYASEQEDHPGRTLTTQRPLWTYLVALLLVSVLVLVWVLR